MAAEPLLLGPPMVVVAPKPGTLVTVNLLVCEVVEVARAAVPVAAAPALSLSAPAVTVMEMVVISDGCSAVVDAGRVLEAWALTQLVMASSS